MSWALRGVRCRKVVDLKKGDSVLKSKRNSAALLNSLTTKALSSLTLNYKITNKAVGVQTSDNLRSPRMYFTLRYSRLSYNSEHSIGIMYQILCRAFMESGFISYKTDKVRIIYISM